MSYYFNESSNSYLPFTELSWVVGYILGWFTCLQTVTHPSINRAQHRAANVYPYQCITTESISHLGVVLHMYIVCVAAWFHLRFLAHPALFYATADEAHAYMFYRCFFVFCFFSVFFSVRHKNTRQPFSGTAERIFMKLLPNDSGENGVCIAVPKWGLGPPINFLGA